MQLRACTACEREFPPTREYFPPHKQCSGGLNSECRPCHNDRIRAWKRANSTRLSERRRVLYAERYGERQRMLEKLRAERFPLRVQASRLMSGIRERSKELDFTRPVELTKKEFFIRWLQRQPSCPCCGVKFSIGFKGGVLRDDAPSIDRFDTTRGYDLDNIALICWRCNNIKRNYQASDLRRVAAWMDVWGNQTDKFAEAAE